MQRAKLQEKMLIFISKAIISYIGSEEIEYIHRNTSPLKISDQDKVLLCSDGRDSRLSDQDLISLVTDDLVVEAKDL